MEVSKVWLVTAGWDYDGEEVIGVWSTEEAAEEHCLRALREEAYDFVFLRNAAVDTDFGLSGPPIVEFEDPEDS